MNKLTVDEFIAQERNRVRLYEILNDPVFQEAAEIVLTPLNAVPPTTTEAAAISGAFASGARHLVAGLHLLTKAPKKQEIKDTPKPLPSAHDIFLSRLDNPNNTAI
jgi:hypothetical protein